MVDNKKLELIFQDGELDYYRFLANPFRYFYTPMAPYESLLSRMVRESLDYIRGGYTPIYQFEGDRPVGYATIVKGGGKYKFCSPDDIVICNVWVDELHRGKGLSRKLISAIISNCGLTYKNAYAFIRHNNPASIKCFEKNDFRKIGNCTKIGLLHKYVECAEGSLGIYKY